MKKSYLGLLALGVSAGLLTFDARGLELVLRQELAGEIFDVSDNRQEMAVYDGESVCLYETHGNRYELSTCRRYPSDVHEFSWSPDSLAVAALGTAANGDSTLTIFRIESTGLKDLSAASDFAKRVASAEDITSVDWLTPNDMVMASACGGSCIEFHHFDMSTMGTSGKCSLDVEGVRKVVRRDGEILAMGHAGSFARVALSKWPKQRQAALVCNVIDEGCLGNGTWKRFEDILGEEDWLLSEQPCKNGAIHQVGAASHVYALDLSRKGDFTVGAPASSNQYRGLIASIVERDQEYFLALSDPSELELRAKKKLHGFFPGGNLNDFDLELLRPIWSEDGHFIALRSFDVEDGIRRFAVTIFEIENYKIGSAVSIIAEAGRVEWLKDSQLAIQRNVVVRIYDLAE